MVTRVVLSVRAAGLFGAAVLVKLVVKLAAPVRGELVSNGVGRTGLRVAVGDA